MITKELKIIPKKIKSMSDYMKEPHPFHNNILGYFKTQEAMDKAIEDSGIIQNRSGEWAIPLIESMREDSNRGNWKRGDVYWGVDPRYEEYKKNKFKNILIIKSEPKQTHL